MILRVQNHQWRYRYHRDTKGTEPSVALQMSPRSESYKTSVVLETSPPTETNKTSAAQQEPPRSATLLLVGIKTSATPYLKHLCQHMHSLMHSFIGPTEKRDLYSILMCTYCRTVLMLAVYTRARLITNVIEHNPFLSS